MITTRQGLIDFCLRQAGGGIHNIEVTPEQLADCVELAIQYYQEFHFDGIERDYIVRRVTATTFVLASATGFAIGDTVYNPDNSISAKITGITGNTVTIGRTGGGVFASTMVVHTATATSTISSIVLGDADNKWVPTDDSIFSVVRILNINRYFSTGDYMFNPQYQIMMAEMKQLTTGGAATMYGMMSYLGHLDFMLTKEKDFRFNRRMNKLYIDIDWNNEINVGDYIAIEVYKAVDDAVYSEVLNDMWLKKYTSALVKKMWGMNLKKYSGMQLPGGLTYNGQTIYDEAVEEIKELEIQAAEQSAPLSFFIG